MKSGQFIRVGPPTGRQLTFNHPFQCKIIKISCVGTLYVDVLLPHCTHDSSQLGTPVLFRHFTFWRSIVSERSRQQSAWHTTLTVPSLCQLATGACKQEVRTVELRWDTINIRWLRFQVLTMMNINDIWRACSLGYWYQYFAGTCCLHLQGLSWW